MNNTKIKSDELWALIRTHIIYSIILHYEFHLKLLNKSSFTDDEKKEKIAKEKDLLLKSLNAIKSLSVVPQEIIDYCRAVDLNQRWFEPVGDLKYNGTFGFFTEMFPTHKEMLGYIHNRLSPTVDLRYSADDKTGVMIQSNGQKIAEIAIDGKITYFPSNRSQGFLIFLNYLFDAGTMPTVEQFEKIDWETVVEENSAG